MQTIVRNGTNVSLYYIEDNIDVSITATETTFSESGTPTLIIVDCNTDNATLYKDVDAVANYWGWKYLYDGSSWSLNSGYKGSDQLRSAIDESVTTLPIVNVNPFPPSGTVQINDEKITYTGVDGSNLLGCTRGAESTTATSHDVQDYVVQI
jgi:hypothetical protein|tara:strand:+ start:1833 stop:2288 length:456 start_codon:yes stop_codon:yes gene_type:complete